MYVIELGTSLPAGYVAESKKATEPGDRVLVSTRGFASTADGHMFVRLLEQFPTEILSKLPHEHRPSQVDTLLVVISPSGTTHIYVNEINAIMTTRVNTAVKAGQPVSMDVISDIQRLEFDKVEIPNDAGMLLVFSIGWRRGLYYDFGPLARSGQEHRKYDLAKVLGGVYAQVLFQERFLISDADWTTLFAAQWFLFIGLPHSLIAKMIMHVQENWSVDDLLVEIAAEVKRKAPEMLSTWRKQDAFAPHLSIVETAIDRFLNGDYISCTGLLYPRIEGILRTYHRSRHPEQQKSLPRYLASSAVATKRDDPDLQSLVLPERFEAYLNCVYFRTFNPDDADIPVSRHSVSHGEAPPDKFDLKSSVISILILHQLFYSFEP
ncbi:MAG: hypothetical protein OXC12_01880 [Spirochaetaceae bacterium]|nr:hypothetical protein [Spirochaetaceae bacterium]